MAKKNTIRNIITLFSAKIDIIDIELIIAHVLKKDRVFIISHNDDLLMKEDVTVIKKFCKKRAAGYPLAYITGSKEFFGRNFIVSENTLIPRDETELIITSILNEINKKQLTNILFCDIGTGSGIIPITLQKELEKENITTRFIASDISQETLEITKKNIINQNISNMRLYNVDLLSDTIFDLCKNTSAKNIFITANLPYVDVEKKDKLFLQPESRALQHEPEDALWSKDSGMAHYKKLIDQTIQLVENIPKKKCIYSFYEIDPDQSNSLQKYIHNKNPHGKISCLKDLTKKNRLIQWVIQT